MKIAKKQISKRTILTITSATALFFVIVLALVSFAVRKRTPDNSTSFESVETESVGDLSNVGHDAAESAFPSEVPVESSEASGEASDVFDEISAESSEVDNELNHGWVINEFGYTYVYDSCGYEQFNYKSTALDRYVNSLNNLAAVIPSSTNLYSITVPVSSTFAAIPRDIYVADNFFNQSQSSFVSTVASRTGERILHVPIISVLEESYDNGEYVFFRTDKNWTSLGAYKAYYAFCEAKGLSAYPLENFIEQDIGDYLGSFYNATKSMQMYDNPDDFILYSSLGDVKTSLTVYDSERVYTNYSLCGNTVDAMNAYDVFLGRDAARYEIHTDVDGGSLLMIGDSSIYPMVSFLASHYSKIDIIIPLNYDKSLADFLVDRSYDDCITMCYSTNAVSGDYVPSFNIFAGVITDE